MHGLCGYPNGTVQKTLLGGVGFLIFAGEIWVPLVQELAESGLPLRIGINLGNPPCIG